MFGKAENKIIPRPLEIQWYVGFFALTKESCIVAPPELADIGAYFSEQIAPATGYDIPVKASVSDPDYRIQLALNPYLISLGDEGYHIVIHADSVLIEAVKPAGIFYGVQTLLQLLPPEIFSQQKMSVPWLIRCCEIMDRPRFPWRGMHLDTARHFMPKAFILKFIDLLAMHKFNRFHWHLTDDQGWRIEIKQYPKLIEIGSRREKTLSGHLFSIPWKYDDTPYEGYYTQDDIREVVAYAKRRFVTVVPEIEMPGHCQAAIAAYPELGNNSHKPIKVRTEWGISGHIFNVEPETMTFLKNVLTEVLGLFDSPYIHIGGDEVLKGQWKYNSRVRERMKALGIRSARQLQAWFMNEMGEFLAQYGRAMIGWDEIRHRKLSKDAVIMAWRSKGKGLRAARFGRNVIMTPSTHTYFDAYQSKPKSKEPLAIGGYVPLKKVYRFEPRPVQMTPKQRKRILGVQGQLWTEYIKTPDHVEYMAFPRACALAEVAWTKRRRKDYPDFLGRLGEHFKRLEMLNVNYRK